jgi:hypothetical protein
MPTGFPIRPVAVAGLKEAMDAQELGYEERVLRDLDALGFSVADLDSIICLLQPSDCYDDREGHRLKGRHYYCRLNKGVGELLFKFRITPTGHYRVTSVHPYVRKGCRRGPKHRAR